MSIKFSLLALGLASSPLSFAAPTGVAQNYRFNCKVVDESGKTGPSIIAEVAGQQAMVTGVDGERRPAALVSMLLSSLGKYSAQFTWTVTGVKMELKVLATFPQNVNLVEAGGWLSFVHPAAGKIQSRVSCKASRS